MVLTSNHAVPGMAIDLIPWIFRIPPVPMGTWRTQLLRWAIEFADWWVAVVYSLLQLWPWLLVITC